MSQVRVLLEESNNLSPVSFRLLIGLFLFDCMSYWIYILENNFTERRYIGHTSDLERRLREHNDKVVGRNRYTRKQRGTWRVIYKEEYATRAEAMKRERFLKSGQGRKWIKANV